MYMDYSLEVGLSGFEASWHLGQVGQDYLLSAYT